MNHYISIYGSKVIMPSPSPCHEPLHEQIWKCCNLRRKFNRVINHYTSIYGSTVIYGGRFRAFLSYFSLVSQLFSHFPTISHLFLTYFSQKIPISKLFLVYFSVKVLQLLSTFFCEWSITQNFYQVWGSLRFAPIMEHLAMHQ